MGVVRGYSYTLTLNLKELKAELSSFVMSFIEGKVDAFVLTDFFKKKFPSFVSLVTEILRNIRNSVSQMQLLVTDILPSFC